jgi:DNA-binding NtrC family response regulator
VEFNNIFTRSAFATPNRPDQLLKTSENGATPMPITALLVEDDPELLALMEAALEDMNLRCVSTTSGEAALAVMLAGDHEIEIVFADIRLAGAIDGIEFAREVKLRWPSLPFVITSGQPGNRLFHQPPDVQFLPKPWKMAQFVATTETALERGRRANSR